jgi:hypothetical protein
MNDMPKIIIGLVVFLMLIGFPIWYNVANDRAGYVPELDKPTKGDQCVRDTEWMRTNHMDLLDEWRDLVVRDQQRFESNQVSPQMEMSLSNTCMDCHSNMSAFCDRCHDYMGVQPYCWDCHIEPQEAI